MGRMESLKSPSDDASRGREVQRTFEMMTVFHPLRSLPRAARKSRPTPDVQPALAA